MYYTASSVINVLVNHPTLSIDNDPFIPSPIPSCPKANDPDGHCEKDFPDCEGRTQNCPQKLRLVNENGDPFIVELFYYTNTQDRDGRIKKLNSMLKLIRTRYGLDLNALVDV